MTPTAGHGQLTPTAGDRRATREVRVGAVAHGGHCVARQADGPVLFVRHALPGERVRVEVTEQRGGFWRADAVEVLEAAPERVEPPCPYARPGLCGGCDFQHATPEAQRGFKATVVEEQLARLGGRPDIVVEVVELPGGPLGWRTRVQYAVDDAGRVGFHPYRSHEVVPVDVCPIAHPAIQGLPVTGERWEGVAAVDVVASAGGDVAVLTRRTRRGRARPFDGPRRVTEVALGRRWTLDAGAFWQIHPSAADVLAATVVELLSPRPTDRAWDLYAGVGLFAAAVAPFVDRVIAVENDDRAAGAAHRCLADLGNVRVVRAGVRQFLAGSAERPGHPGAQGARGGAGGRGGSGGERVDLVVLDPPRGGAGREIVEVLSGRRPRAVAYVACDPAAFARDVAAFADRGYDLRAVRAFDAFPMTHHVECVGLFEPAHR